MNNSVEIWTKKGEKKNWGSQAKIQHDDGFWCLLVHSIQNPQPDIFQQTV